MSDFVYFLLSFPLRIYICGIFFSPIFYVLLKDKEPMFMLVPIASFLVGVVAWILLGKLNRVRRGR